MSARRAAIILWCVLVVLVPLPVWQAGRWGGMPPLRVAREALAGAPELWWQALLGAVVALFLALLYRRWSPRLPARIRGALVGLLALSALIVLSAVPVYRWPGESGALTFLELYGSPPPR